ncbi:membrane metallo-endopeptidase-like 1 [Drosophila serrata]|uniref:membrane metallo-endopeptidase-like 1 n=1 Tax=Drosophila serrata TaxID=7274 RepID=UPI000A1D1DD3|nr:membrane metallo-endopeptidase-like 1 [Drosophila serrata]
MANSRQETEKMMGGGAASVPATCSSSMNGSHEGSLTLSPGSGSATLMRHSPDINQQHPYGNYSEKMEGITRFLCLLLLIGLTRSRHPSPDEATLDFIYKNLDDTANPCQNFQNFSSGKFKSLHTKDKLNDLRDSIFYASNDKLQIVLEALKDRVFIDESSVEGKVLRYFNSCLNFNISDSTLLLDSYLELMPPGEDLPWPTSRFHGSKWPKERFQWLEALAGLRRFGIENLLFRMNVIQGWYEPNQFVIFLKRSTYSNILSEDIIRRIVTGVGVPKKNYISINTLVDGIAALGSDLHNLPQEETRLYTLSIEQFEDQTGIQLSKYLEITFGRPFDPSFEVKLVGIGYLEGLKAVIEKHEKEVVVGYMITGIVFSLINLDIMQKVKSNQPNQCAAAVHRHMELASEMLYKDYYFRQGRHQRYDQEVQKMFEVFRSAFLKRIEKNRLNLTTEQQSFVKQKLLAIKVRLGSLPNIANQRRFLHDFYSDLELDIDTADMARIQLNIMEHNTRHTLEQLDRATLRGNHFFLLEEYGYNLQTEPHYKTSNLVVVPYDILQEPYFSPDQHDVFKVSLLGFSIIRAALENFSPYFMRFDNESNYSEIMDYFKENLAYVEATNCMSVYEESSIHDEHLTDVVALGLVYDVYFGEDSKFSQEQPNFTKLPLKQLFLLNFAQNLMDKRRTVRLNQAVRNLKDFGKVFDCPADTVLNPEVKCEIW